MVNYDLAICLIAAHYMKLCGKIIEKGLKIAE
jgi:hypothetical protein